MSAPKMQREAHEVTSASPVLTIVGNDGVRWACNQCGETVFYKDGRHLHFDKTLNPPEETA